MTIRGSVRRNDTGAAVRRNDTGAAVRRNDIGAPPSLEITVSALRTATGRVSNLLYYHSHTVISSEASHFIFFALPAALISHFSL
jgi:hypothetical protein